VTTERQLELKLTERDPLAALELVRRIDAFAAAMQELGMVVTVSGSLGIVVRPAPPDPDQEPEP
jgi:hypothetical protein